MQHGMASDLHTTAPHSFVPFFYPSEADSICKEGPRTRQEDGQQKELGLYRTMLAVRL